MSQLHAQLNAFNVQATLIVGFALGTFNADNLTAISNDLSSFCVYKRHAREDSNPSRSHTLSSTRVRVPCCAEPIITCVYIVLTFTAIGTCAICLGLSFYIVVHSQYTANEVSVTHTLALVRQLQSQILFYYFLGLVAFFVSLYVEIIMYIERAHAQQPKPSPRLTLSLGLALRSPRYIGQYNWIPLIGEPGPDNTTIFATGSRAGKEGCNTQPGPNQGGMSASGTGLTGNPSCDSYDANGWAVQAVTLDTGENLMTCLNPYDMKQQYYQRMVGLVITCVTFLTFAVMFCTGLYSFMRVRRKFYNMTQLPEVKAMAKDAAPPPNRGNSRPQTAQ